MGACHGPGRTGAFHGPGRAGAINGSGQGEGEGANPVSHSFIWHLKLGSPYLVLEVGGMALHGTWQAHPPLLTSMRRVLPTAPAVGGVQREDAQAAAAHNPGPGARYEEEGGHAALVAQRVAAIVCVRVYVCM